MYRYIIYILKFAIESDPYSVLVYYKRIKQIVTNINQMIFIDESWRNNKTSDRTRGYALKYFIF